MLRTVKKLLHDKRGMSGLIVFAILLPFLGAFVIAVAQTTIISVGQSVVNNAAFEGARIGALKNSTTEGKNAANNLGRNVLGNWDSRATVKATKSNNIITVTVEYKVPIYSYFNSLNMNIPKKVQSSSSQRVESSP